MSRQRLPRTDFNWTPDLAYVVGLITTDGCLSKDGRHIDLTSKDIDQIETFKKILGLKCRIGTKINGLKNNIYYRVQFGDVVFYDWLVKIGLSPRKSLTLGSLSVNREYFKDFLRGCLDGDGNITFYIDRYNTYINPKYVYKRLFVRFYSGSRNYLLWLQKIINKDLHINGAMITNKTIKEEKHPNYSLKFSTKEAKILLNWIYYEDGLPCLKRKYEIAKPFLVYN